MTTPPGWYPDPHDAARARYWDGTSWTDDTRAREALEGGPAGEEPTLGAEPTVGAGARPTVAAGGPAGSGGSPPPSGPEGGAGPAGVAGPGGGGGSTGGGTADAAGGGGGRRRWVWAAVLVLVALLAGGGAYLALSLGAGEAEAAVVLEPTGSTGVDPWSESIASEHVDALSDEEEGVGLGETDDPRTEGSQTALAGQVAPGTAPGLYGGTRNTQVCDVRQLRRFLTDPANADLAEAWAAVQDIEPDEIRAYLGELTAVRLSFATRVTNHGFSDGAANPVQSLLQAGTAVLVDESGVPRVKCDCGNPLREPEDAGGGEAALDIREHASNPEDAWQGLDTSDVVSVRPGEEPVEEITLNDLEGDGLLERPVGSDGASMPDTGTGDVRIKLEWASDADLDLHVTEPSGTEISYQNEGPTETGGRLDVDSNVGCDNDGAVENIFWPPGEGPSGTYQVEVVGFQVAGCGSGEFTLTIEVAGQEPEVHTGSVGEDESAEFSFSVGSDGSGTDDGGEASEPEPEPEAQTEPEQGSDPGAQSAGGCPEGTTPSPDGELCTAEGFVCDPRPGGNEDLATPCREVGGN